MITLLNLSPSFGQSALWQNWPCKPCPKPRSGGQRNWLFRFDLIDAVSDGESMLLSTTKISSSGAAPSPEFVSITHASV